MPVKSSKKILSRSDFYFKLLKYFGFSSVIIFFSLAIGMLGYRYYGNLPWIDAFLNASMILTGMGPVNLMESPAAKLFAGFYALYSGIAFLSTVAILLTPVLHRALHKIHIYLSENE